LRGICSANRSTIPVQIRAAAADFDAFMQGRDRIASAYSNGNPAPLDAVVAREGAATFFPPHGPIVKGSAAVAKRYHQDAKMHKKMTLRITEVFRRIHGEWKLVHRHADG
jgi:ketosteroid isomerase-like protein